MGHGARVNVQSTFNHIFIKEQANDREVRSSTCYFIACGVMCLLSPRKASDFASITHIQWMWWKIMMITPMTPSHTWICCHRCKSQGNNTNSTCLNCRSVLGCMRDGQAATTGRHESQNRYSCITVPTGGRNETEMQRLISLRSSLF